MKKKELEALKFPNYINTSERSITVVGVIKGGRNDGPENYIDGKGYIDIKTDKIWIFCEEKPNKAFVNAYPYFWFEGKFIKKSKPSLLIQTAYSVDNIQDLSLHNVIDKTIPGEKLYNEAEIMDINASSSFYIPTIHAGDDFLKKIVKIIIIEKGIDINRLKCKSDVPYKLANMKTALNNDTKMSVSYFASWMELLGCTFDVIIRDNGEDTVNPLSNQHIYDFEKDKMSIIIDGREVEIDTSKYMTTEDIEHNDIPNIQ